MLTCAILDDYQGVATTFADWSPLRDSARACVSFREGFATQDALVAAIADCEIVVVMRERTPFPAALFARLPKLRLLVTSGMRNASHRPRSGQGPRRRGLRHGERLRASGGADLGADPGACPPRRAGGERAAGRRMADRAWAPISPAAASDCWAWARSEPASRSIGQAFGMTVSAWSPNLTAKRAMAEVGVALSASKAALMAESDVVSIHLVLGDRTRGLVDAEALALMRPHALLINTARAGLVDGPALQAALAEGRIGGAGLDVFEIEPLPADSPWRSLPNLLALPHLGYVSEANYRTYFTEAVADIQGFLDGAPVRVIG